MDSLRLKEAFKNQVNKELKKKWARLHTTAVMAMNVTGRWVCPRVSQCTQENMKIYHKGVSVWMCVDVCTAQLKSVEQNV